ncbi:tyrosine recombinase [Escherichia coli]|nr:tyrosine recombinase [Escherichia coli]
MDSLAPIVLYLFVFFNFIINKLNQTSSLFNFSFMRLFLSHNPAKRAALLAVRFDEREAVERWTQERANWKGADRTDAIFISRRGSRLSRQQAYRIIRDAGIEAGTVTQTHPHMLRHACGYELAERGADTRLIQDYLGHRNIRHTVRYTASNAARFAGLWERNNLINEKLKREEV